MTFYVHSNSIWLSINKVSSRNETISRKSTIIMSRFLVTVFFVVFCVLLVSGAPVKEETTTKAKDHPTSTTTTEKSNPSVKTHMCGEKLTSTTTTKKPHDELTHKEAIRRLRDTTHDKHPGTTTTTTHKPYTPPAHKANVDLLKKDAEMIKCPVSKESDSKKDDKKTDSGHIFNPLEVLGKSGKH